MARKEEPQPRVAVRDVRRITVDMSAEEVEHALRCWLMHTIRGVHRLPPAADFNQVSVNVLFSDEERLLGATVSYDAKRVPEPIILYEAHDWGEDDSNVIWWTFPIAEPPYVGTPIDSDWPFGENYEKRGDLRWQRLTVPIIDGDDQNAFGG